MKMRVFIGFVVVVFLLNGCSPSNNTGVEEVSNSDSSKLSEYLDASSELSTTQQAAFDALNTLQVSTDEKNRLYSTFAGIDQPCYPPDTTFTISQAELLLALQEFVSSNCQNLAAEEREQLAAAAVLAQEEYILSLCLDDSQETTYENGPPMTGTWVLPKVLGRRDITLVW